MTASTTSRCPSCHGPLPDPGRGRPNAFCTTGCRRDAEAERRRIGRRLQRIADDRARLRGFQAAYADVADEPDFYGPYLAQLKAELRVLDAEEAAARIRLRELFAATSPPTTERPAYG